MMPAGWRSLVRRARSPLRLPRTRGSGLIRLIGRLRQRRPSLPITTAVVAGLALVSLLAGLGIRLEAALVPAPGAKAPAQPIATVLPPEPSFVDLRAGAGADLGLWEPAAGPVPVEPPLPEPARPTSLPDVPTAPPELADVALELERRREELLALEARLAVRETALRTAEADLEARLDRLETLRAELEALTGAAADEEEARLQQLVKVYEGMRAKSAAAIFDRLDLPVLLPVARRMRESKMAGILAAMDPGRARVVTTELARELVLPTLD